MPRDDHYSQEKKRLMFNVIKFIEGEKNGATIPLYNVNDRIMAAFQISHGSLVNLKNELKQLEEEEQKVLQQQLLEQKQQQRPYVLAQKYKNERLRRRSSSPYTIPTTDQSRSTNTARPVAKPPAKRGGPTNLKISLTDEGTARGAQRRFASFTRCLLEGIEIGKSPKGFGLTALP